MGIPRKRRTQHHGPSRATDARTRLPPRSYPGATITVQVVQRAAWHGAQYTVTIPRYVAEALGLQKGDTLGLKFNGKQIILELQKPTT